jgi:hypothetical protein
MQGIGEAIKYLYQQFILRDVVAYVTPGTIITVCALKVLLGTAGAITFIKEIPAAAYLPLYGALFMTGLALERFGESTGILRFHNRRRSKNRSADHEHFRILQDFHRATSAVATGKSAAEDKDKNAGIENAFGSALERTRERITVKKYASGNIAVALMFSMILIGFTKLRPNLSVWAVVGLGVLLVAALMRVHWFQLKLQGIWEDQALEPRTKD